MTKRGFTLIEVLAAFGVVAIVIISLIAAITQSMVFSKRVDAIYTSSYLAQRRMDLLKRFAFDELYPDAVESNVRVGADGNVSPQGEYMRTTEITDNYGGNPFLKKVKVTVYRLRINMDGSVTDPVTGDINFMPNPVIVETMFADVK